MNSIGRDRHWKLFERALRILEGRANGHALPIIQKLACRGFPPAVSILSDYLSDAEAIKILRKVARRGDAVSAYNLAVTYRNRGDLLNYRHALSRAARLDEDAAEELRGFKLRFPQEAMRRFHRSAPEKR
jgi:TPR repeat protein